MKTLRLRVSLLVAAIVLLNSAAIADTITVNSTADPAGYNNAITIAQLGATVTLRDAVNAANNTAGDDEIAFAPALSGQAILLTQVGASTPITGPNDAMRSALSITSTVTVRGPAGGVTIARDQAVSRLRLFLVTSSGNLTLEGLTLADGLEAKGAAIENNGILAVRSSTIRNGFAQVLTNSFGFARGGGIYNAGTLTVTDSVFSANRASISGGAIYNATGSPFTVTNTVFDSCSANTSGGAIATADDGGLSSVSRSTFNGNRVIGTSNFDTNDHFGGGAIANRGTLAVSSSTFDNNRTEASFNGGGIRNYGTLNLSASTFVRNASAWTNSNDPGSGGGLETSGSATVTNCTFTQNAAFWGTAIRGRSGSTLVLNHCTIVAQQNATDGEAAVWLQGNSTITNSIICRNYWRSSFNGAVRPGNVRGGFSGSNNVINDENPGVGDLASKGGPTQTMPLLSNSPAVEAGIPTEGVTIDQRGVGRPQGVAVDIGAFEFGVEPPVFTSANTANFIIGTTNQFQVTASSSPASTFSVNGTLPSGVTFTSSGLLSGTPTAGTEGSYPLTLTATNSFGEASQQFVLTVSRTDLLVTTAVDEDDGSADPALGAGTSLHEAFNLAKTLGGSPTIFFSSALAGQTILCTIDQGFSEGPSAFRMVSTVTIQGLTGTNGITIARGVAGDMRAFEVFGGTLTLNDLTLANWRSPNGAAIYHASSVRLNRCTLRDNFSTTGIIVSAGVVEATLVNCTVANNQGSYALRSNGLYSLTNTTVTGNTGGGLYVSNNGATLINTIIAGNTRDGNPWDFGQGFARTGSVNNLIGTGGSGGLTNGSNGNIVGVPANQLPLGPLADNGGPTQTMALLGGPAIDGGATVAAVTTDQRGVSRPQHNRPDIGAYEYDIVTPSLVVTTAGDELNVSSDPRFGTGTSLREALAYAQSLGGAQTITFAPSLAGQTVTLNRGWNDNDASALRVSSQITLQGPTTSPGVTIGMAAGVQKRHIRVEDSGNLTVSNLSFSGGRAPDYGGSIWSFGALTVRGCTFSQNQAAGEGGAIQSWGGAPLLVIENSTFSGNSAVNEGGAIATGAIQNTWRYLTIANNTCPNSAVWIYETPVTMVNSIIAGNTSDAVQTSGGNGSGTFSAQSTNNILGAASATGLTNGENANQRGVLVSQLYLGALSNNGGPTPTIALQSGSLAIDAGAAIDGLTIDQRGASRSHGPASDIGAFELVQTAAAIPIVSPLGGTYENSVQITITSTSAGTAVRYTLDGSTPSAAHGHVYSAPFTLTRSTTVKAVAYGVDWLDSPVASVEYTLLPPLAYWRRLQGLPADGSQDLANPSGDGISNLAKYAFNLAANEGDLARPNAITLAPDGNAGLPRADHDGQGRLVLEFVRRKASTGAGISYIVETGSDLLSWTPLSLTNAIVTSIDGTWERVTVTDPTVAATRFGRVRLITLGDYANDFNAALGAATLRGHATWTNQAVRLTDTAGDQLGAVVLNGIALGSHISGFRARFNLQLGPTTTSQPADGASFAVGNLGGAAWGERGPSTARHIAVGFDTHPGSGNDSIGVHVWVNGVRVATNPLNPYTNGASVPVEISYDSGSGLTVKFNGTTLFNGIAISGFSFLSTDQFGIGARTGGANERAVVDDVEIALR